MDYKALLEKNGLKKTPARLDVLQFFDQSDFALSQPDLEHKFGDKIDRVTLYRILSVFEQKGIIHKIMDVSGTGKYALCHSNCEAEHHHDEHLHFNCLICHKTFCFNDTVIPHVVIPAGFDAREITLSANGVCPQCQEKKA